MGMHAPQVHNLARGSVLGGDPPVVEGERINLLGVPLPGDVLTQQMYPPDADVRRWLLRPLHGHVMNGRRGEVGAELHLKKDRCYSVDRAGQLSRRAGLPRAREASALR